jgi:hypothetical protein
LQQLLNLSQLNSQLEQMNLTKEEQENKLTICQNQMKMCKQAGADIGQTLKLLEEELEIQKTLRDLERDVQKMKEKLTMSNMNRSANFSLSSLESASSLSESQNQKASSQYENTISNTYFHPDDVFNSDDSIDDELSDQFLLSQNRISSEAIQCPVDYQYKKLGKGLFENHNHDLQFDDSQQVEELRK